MGQREYDDFKLLVKEWKDSHPEEYRAFVEEIGTKSFRVYNKMIALASRYVSGFQKAVRKQILDSSCGSVDLSELVMQFRKKGLGEELLRQFNGQDRKSIVPAMLAWMYFGDSFETMVAHGEDLLSQYRYNFLYRAGIVALIKHTIDISIKEGFRTQADWDSFRKRQKAIKSGEIVDWAVDEVKMESLEEDTVEAEDEVPRRTPGRKSDRRTLPELLFDDPERYMAKIGHRLRTHSTESDLARLYIALVEYRIMRQCPIKTFRNALQAQYEDIRIVNERGIQRAYQNLTTPLGPNRKLMKDTGDDRAAIEELKAFLSD